MKNSTLCKWLRANSSGAYRNCALAASVIESQDKTINQITQSWIPIEDMCVPKLLDIGNYRSESEVFLFKFSCGTILTGFFSDRSYEDLELGYESDLHIHLLGRDGYRCEIGDAEEYCYIPK